MKKLNFIFSGVYLKVWYVACFITITIMVVNFVRLNRVQDFELTLFDSGGNVVSTEVVHLENDYEKTALYTRLPATKVFKPIK
ncbi:MAG: hypothetical protein LBV09_02030 [Deferribacteraceae bacterium]|jgi:hypothetical protein|nr:hypothetical protein [Deferribacteraceae bacterium]